jgi:hypothetical protein
MNRNPWRKTVALKTTANAAGAEKIPMANFASGKIYIPTGSPITTLTFYALSGVAGQPLDTNVPYAPADADWTQVADKNDALISRTVQAGRNYPLPDELFGDGTVQIVANAAGNVDLALKS